MDEIQRFQDKRNLDQMLREQRGETDSVSKAAKRNVSAISINYDVAYLYTGPHQARGATEKKTRKLDELKAKRKAKSERKRVIDGIPFRVNSLLQRSILGPFSETRTFLITC